MARYIDANSENVNPKTINGVTLNDAIDIFEKSEYDLPSELFIAITTIRDFAEWYRDEIKNAPTADVKEVVRGEWSNQYCSGISVSKGCVSSCCDLWNERRTKFCPNCGAKMGEVE